MANLLQTLKAGKPIRVPVSGTTEARITLGEFKGRKLIHIRKYFLDIENSTTEQITNRDEEAFKPTKKGVAFKYPDQFLELGEAIAQLTKEIQEESASRVNG